MVCFLNKEVGTYFIREEDAKEQFNSDLDCKRMEPVASYST